jgi:hypothetical protein
VNQEGTKAEISSPRKWNWKPLISALVVIGALCVLIFAGRGSAENLDTSLNNTVSNISITPMRTPKSWGTTHVFRGNGILKTEIFYVGDDWKILWSCDLNNSPEKSYDLQVSVDNVNGNTPQDTLAMDSMCKDGNISGITEMHKGGNVYLSISAMWAWTLTVQEPQY